MLLGKDAERFSLWGKKEEKKGEVFLKKERMHTHC